MLYQVSKYQKKNVLSSNTLIKPDFWPQFYIVVLGMTFFFHFNQFTFSNFYLDFYFPSLFGPLFLFPFSNWTFIFLFFLFELLYPPFSFSFFLSFFFNSFSFFYSIAVTFWMSSNVFLQISAPVSKVGRIKKIKVLNYQIR